MNTFIKTFTYLFLVAFLSLSIFNPLYPKDPAPVPTQIAQQGPGIPGLPQMSETEMKQFEAELAELNSKLEGLSPEQQEAVLNEMVQEAMEEVRKDLSDEGKAILDKLEQGDITEEDFDKLLNELIPAEEKETPKPVEAKPTPKVVEPKILITSKHQEILDRINSLINHTNLFIQKAGTIAELPGKINQWEKEKKISWQPKLTWNTFRSDLDIFVSKLNKLKEQDPKTQQYKHLDELLKNETLCNNLSKVEKIAAEFEPKIEEIAPIGGQPVPESSKVALQKLLSQYNEALYILKLSSVIDALFEKFEPKAKLSREAEEKTLKDAQLEQKKTRTPTRPAGGGMAASPERYRPQFEDNYNDYDRFNSNTHQSNQVFIPTHEPRNEDSFLPSSRSQTASKSSPSSFGGSHGGGKDNHASKEDKHAAHDARGSDSSDHGKEGKEKAPVIPHQVKKAMEKEKELIEAVVNPLKDIGNIIKDNKVLSELEAEVKKSPYNKTLVDKLLPDLDSSLRRAKRELDSFNASFTTKSADLKKNFTKQVKDKAKKSLETLNTFITQLDGIENIKGTLPLENQYVYFGTVDKQEYMAATLEKTLLEPADRDRFLELWQEEGADFTHLTTTAQRFIDEENPTPDVQQALKDMATAIDSLNKVEQELPRPVSLSYINKLAQEVRQAIA